MPRCQHCISFVANNSFKKQKKPKTFLGPAGGQHLASNSNTSCNPIRGPNSVSSLVRLALSPNFPGGLLSTAQSYPSLTSSGQVAGSGVTTTTGPGLGQALTMSLTSTSSDSEQVKLSF